MNKNHDLFPKQKCWTPKNYSIYFYLLLRKSSTALKIWKTIHAPLKDHAPRPRPPQHRKTIHQLFNSTRATSPNKPIVQLFHSRHIFHHRDYFHIFQLNFTPAKITMITTFHPSSLAQHHSCTHFSTFVLHLNELFQPQSNPDMTRIKNPTAKRRHIISLHFHTFQTNHLFWTSYNQFLLK